MEEKDRIALLKLTEKYELQEILATIGVDTGFQGLINALYDATAKTASDYNAASLFARSEGQKNKAEHIDELTNNLNNLVNLLENATDYCVASSSRPANEDEILQANVGFSIGEVFKVFCIQYGIGTTLEAFIKTIKALEKHHREISEISGQSKTTFAQETSEKHLRKARRLANLLQALIVGKDLYQTNQGLVEPLKDEEDELCQTSTN